MTKTTELAIRAKAAIRYPWLAAGHRRPHHSGAYRHDGQTADGHVQEAPEPV